MVHVSRTIFLPSWPVPLPLLSSYFPGVSLKFYLKSGPGAENWLTIQYLATFSMHPKKVARFRPLIFGNFFKAWKKVAKSGQDIPKQLCWISDFTKEYKNCLITTHQTILLKILPAWSWSLKKRSLGMISLRLQIPGYLARTMIAFCGPLACLTQCR